MAGIGVARIYIKYSLGVKSVGEERNAVGKGTRETRLKSYSRLADGFLKNNSRASDNGP